MNIKLGHVQSKINLFEKKALTKIPAPIKTIKTGMTGKTFAERKAVFEGQIKKTLKSDLASTQIQAEIESAIDTATPKSMMKKMMGLSGLSLGFNTKGLSETLFNKGTKMLTTLEDAVKAFSEIDFGQLLENLNVDETSQEAGGSFAGLARILEILEAMQEILDPTSGTSSEEAGGSAFEALVEEMLGIPGVGNVLEMLGLAVPETEVS